MLTDGYELHRKRGMSIEKFGKQTRFSCPVCGNEQVRPVILRLSLTRWANAFACDTCRMKFAGRVAPTKNNDV